MNFQVEWLPLSLFDSHSQFALSFNETMCYDVTISGGAMTVTSFTADGEYRSVNFESCDEFVLFAKNEMKQLVGEE